MKILMITSSMGTGGAESHIASLSRALRALGNTVVLCSAGGVTAEQLAAEGFACHTLPLASSRPADVSLSYRMLGSLLAAEHFDVVHAHARIPACLVGRIRQKLGKRADFRFCVTCHAAFRATPFYRRLTDWGDGTVAVSEDLRTYLTEHYDINPDRITVIPNGIDCRRFSPADGTGLLMETAGELALPSSEAEETASREILFMSRLDEDCSAVAERLISLAPRLQTEYPGVSVTLAGGGEAFERLLPLAKQNGVLMTGEVADPLPLLRRCEVFVGVSRAALEAAAVGKPVILAGNEGYLGILDDDTRPLAEATNYTCRGYGQKPIPLPRTRENREGKRALPAVTGDHVGAYAFGYDTKTVASRSHAVTEIPSDAFGERLYADLAAVLSASPEFCESLGTRNRAAVLETHSAERTAKQTLSFYETLPRRMPGKHILVGGYFGYGNSGDDATAEVLVSRIRRLRPDKEVVLLSRDPERDARRYGTPCVDRASPAALARAMKNACLYVTGGGSLLQNLTSDRSLSYYLWLMKLARRHHVPVSVLSGGVGPLRGKHAEKKVASALSRAAYVGLRDRRSLDYLRRLGVPEDKLFLGADPALLLEPAEPGRLAELMRIHRLKEDGRYLAVSLGRAEGFARAKLVSVVSETCRRNRLTPLYFVLFPEQDQESADAVCSAVGFGGKVMPILTPREIVGILPYCEAALSLRLHLLVYAEAAGIPAVGISGSDPKIAAFSEETGMPETVTLPAASPEKIAVLFGKLLERRDEICYNYRNCCVELQRRAEEDLMRVLSLVPR